MRNLIKLLTVTALLSLTATGAWADKTWTSGQCTVTLDDDSVLTVRLTLAGLGKMSSSSHEWTNSEYSGKIKTVIIERGVQNICDDAFYKCSNITSVTIGKDVEEIGKYAFYKCSSLTSVNIPDGVTEINSNAFDGCTSLASVNIPSSMTHIRMYAFQNCTSLTSVNIPSSVRVIDLTAFFYCKSLTAFTVEEGNNYFTSVDGVLFNKKKTKLEIYPIAKNGTSYNVPDGVTTIGGHAFQGCSGLKAIVIPEGVTKIESGAFIDCSGLESIEIPESMTSISTSSFNCTGLTSITIPANVTYIGDQTFYGSTALKEVVIMAKSLEHYGRLAFYGTSPGLSIYVPAGSLDDYETGLWSIYKDKLGVVLTGDSDGDGGYWTSFYEDGSERNFTPDGNTTVYKCKIRGLQVKRTEVADIPAQGAVILTSRKPTMLLARTASATADLEENDLKGSTAEVSGAEGNIYVLDIKDSKGLAFYKLSPEYTLAAGKAYLTYEGSEAPELLRFTIGGTTGIDHITSPSPDSSPVWERNGCAVFDMQGRRVESPTKGLYIIDGKKHIIK